MHGTNDVMRDRSFTSDSSVQMKLLLYVSQRRHNCRRLKTVYFVSLLPFVSARVLPAVIWIITQLNITELSAKEAEQIDVLQP